jgi:hypothetical protein
MPEGKPSVEWLVDVVRTPTSQIALGYVGIISPTKKGGF